MNRSISQEDRTQTGAQVQRSLPGSDWCERHSSTLFLWILRLSVVLLAIVAYLPAINNSFISDDFTLLRYLRELEKDPSRIWGTASEFFRSMSYLYFWVNFRLFGLRPEFYYLSSIALHVAVSLLVFGLVRTITGRTLTAWVAALFFAVYARHEEAVMWISANNSTILTLNCLIFLTLWERHLAGVRPRLTYAAAVVMFLIALFSKESAVALLPLAALRTGVKHSPREVIRKLWPLAAICAGFVVLWLSQSGRNFFVTDGHYTLGLHFPTVYGRSLLSLLSSALPFIAALLLLRKWKRGLNPNGRSLAQILRSSNVPFFMVWMCLVLIPVSFLTYSKYIPSRNTYFPSVALAALVGILLTTLLDHTRLATARRAWGLMLVAVLAWNGQYLWRRQDPEYVKRAAPTRELVALLNGKNSQLTPLRVCGFPLHESIGSAAVAELTRFRVEDVLFVAECSVGDIPFARWDEASLGYSTDFTAALETNPHQVPAARLP